MTQVEPIDKKRILDLVKRYERSRTGQPLFVINHQVIRNNYERFRENFPRVQVYYAIKANSEPAILRTLYE
jgi:ornithine decarboxylase